MFQKKKKKKRKRKNNQRFCEMAMANVCHLFSKFQNCASTSCISSLKCLTQTQRTSSLSSKFHQVSTMTAAFSYFPNNRLTLRTPPVQLIYELNRPKTASCAEFTFATIISSKALGSRSRSRSRSPIPSDNNNNSFSSSLPATTAPAPSPTSPAYEVDRAPANKLPSSILRTVDGLIDDDDES